MALHKFIIERDIPKVGTFDREQLKAASAKSNSVLAELAPDIQWIESFVAADKTFCVYLAKDQAIIRKHAEMSGFPATKITEIGKMIDPHHGGRGHRCTRAGRGHRPRPRSLEQAMSSVPAEVWTFAGLGAFHGLNPAMGWLFAVALGLHRQSRTHRDDGAAADRARACRIDRRRCGGLLALVGYLVPHDSCASAPAPCCSAGPPTTGASAIATACASACKLACRVSRPGRS